MVSRIDIGPSGGPYVELDESSGDFVLRVPNNLFNVNNARVTNADNPTADSDLATKSYVDSIEQGLDVKDSVRAATDGTNIDLTSSTDPNPIDGVTLNDGDRVLLKDQTDATENGIYNAATATDPTTWVRADDADEDSEVTDGLFTFVAEGTNFDNRGFVLTSDDTITLGTSDINFTQFSGAGEINAGTALLKDGDTLNVDDTQFASATHDLGGSAHGADTLANLNSKVSDATLDDTGDARPPETHSTTHESGGADEISVFNLAGTLAGQGLEVVSSSLQILSGIYDGTNIVADVSNTLTNSSKFEVGGNTLAQSVAASGQVSLSSGSATVSTGITATDATFYPAIGVDDPGADVIGLAAQLDFDTSTGEYKLTVKETDSSQNPTVNYDIVRVR